MNPKDASYAQKPLCARWIADLWLLGGLGPDGGAYAAGETSDPGIWAADPTTGESNDYRVSQTNCPSWAESFVFYTRKAGETAFNKVLTGSFKGAWINTGADWLCVYQLTSSWSAIPWIWGWQHRSYKYYTKYVGGVPTR
jgi:hypothetical protein